MKVKELIEILEKMDQEAVVNCWTGSVYQDSQWNDDIEVVQESCGWDGHKVINEVFIQ
ncbi:hypothetical protein D3C85_392800 [compost metagenome]